MPYRLIYKGEIHPAEATAPGCGVVARSERMPQALVSRLVELAKQQNPASQSLCGSLYSYCAEGIAGQIWHILAAAQRPGGGHTYTVHFLVLTQKEVQTACALAEDTTPARMAPAAEADSRQDAQESMLSSRMPSEAQYLPLSGSAWQALTGRSDNAKLLHTQPYRSGSLIAVPASTDSLQALQLLHESQLLSPTLGWGIPFSSAEASLPVAQGYLFTTHGSPLHTLAQRTGRPVLELTHELHSPADATTTPTQPAPRPYIYHESRDTDTFYPTL